MYVEIEIDIDIEIEWEREAKRRFSRTRKKPFSAVIKCIVQIWIQSDIDQLKTVKFLRQFVI